MLWVWSNSGSMWQKLLRVKSSCCLPPHNVNSRSFIGNIFLLFCITQMLFRHMLNKQQDLKALITVAIRPRQQSLHRNTTTPFYNISFCQKRKRYIYDWGGRQVYFCTETNVISRGYGGKSARSWHKTTFSAAGFSIMMTSGHLGTLYLHLYNHKHMHTKQFSDLLFHGSP